MILGSHIPRNVADLHPDRAELCPTVGGTLGAASVTLSARYLGRSP